MNENSIWHSIFDIREFKNLHDFSDQLHETSPDQAAIKYYIGRWCKSAAENNEEHFQPDKYFSRDGSAAMYDGCPVIFEGANNWSHRPYDPIEKMEKRTSQIARKIENVKKASGSRPICLALPPEKDYLISKFFLGETRFSKVDSAVESLFKRLRLLDIPCFFSDTFPADPLINGSEKLDYADSHLTAAYYSRTALAALAAFNLDPDLAKARILTEDVRKFGDLSKKFMHARLPIDNVSRIAIKSDVSLKSGTETLGKPLGTTRQTFINESPVYDLSISVLGDSHSSIFSERRFTYIFSSLFRECKFAWNPCGLRASDWDLDADLIFLEASSRFAL